MRVWLCFLFSLLLVVPCIGQTIEDVKEIGINLVFLALGEIPHVGKIIGLFAPAAKKLLGLKQDQPQQQQQQQQLQIDYSKDFKEIQKGLRKMRSDVLEAVGRVEIAVELAHVKDAEKDAKMLMGFLEDVFHSDNPSSTNRSINIFLEKCNKFDPYERLLNMSDEMEKAYRLQLRNDIYHGKPQLDSRKLMLNGILNELTFVAVAQHHFSENESHEMRDESMDKWKRRLDGIRNATQEVFEEMLQMPYWDEMDGAVAKVLGGHADADIQVAVTKMRDYVFNIYTSDRFCMMVSRQELGGRHSRYNSSKFDAFADDEHLHSFEHNGYFIEIIRSKTADKMTEHDFAAFHKSVEDMQKLYRSQCPFKDRKRYYKDVLKYNYSAFAIYEKPTNEILICDSHARFTMPPIQCEVWHNGHVQRPSYIVHALPF